jgi:hypothetical protein
MKQKMRCNLPGTFLARPLGEDAWRLSRTQPESVDVFLKGVEPGAAEILRAPTLHDIDIEWRAGESVMTVTSAERRRTLRAHSAIVHEPLGHLYEALPLASLDEKARRFWRRVFRLVRIPGGRHLLGVLARSTRSTRKRR